MSEDLNQTVGRIEGKLDALVAAVHSWQSTHSARHEIIDAHLDDINRDVNMAKGAKGAILWIVSIIAAVIGAVAALIVKWVKF